MNKRIRYTANDDNYHQRPGITLSGIMREILGFCAGFTIVSIMMLLVVIGWQ